MTGKPFSRLAAQLRAAVSRRAGAMEKPEQQIRRELGWEEERWDELFQGGGDMTLRQVEELAAALGAAPLELLAEVYEAAEPDGLPPGLLDLVAEQAATLEQTSEVLQQAQALLALPAREDVTAMRRGDRPVTRTAYLLAQLQTASVKAENIASDLKTDLEYGFEPGGIDLVPAFFNALEAAVERLSGSGRGT
jgi:hypothetical protein